MKLHTEAKEGVRGLLFKSKVWKMNSRIELSPEEDALLRANPDVGKMTVAIGRFHAGIEIECSVKMLVKGMSGSVFHSLAQQTDFERQLREGCGSLKAHFDRLKEIGGGPQSVEF